MPGYHGPRSGGLDGVRSEARSSGHSPRRRVPETHAGAGRKLVRALGRRLCLRHVPGVAGLEAAGESSREAYILRAGEWLRSIQNADGGWGESCASYDQKTFVAAASTPSQTAWAILGLLASGDSTSDSIQ